MPGVLARRCACTKAGCFLVLNCPAAVCPFHFSPVNPSSLRPFDPSLFLVQLSLTHGAGPPIRTQVSSLCPIELEEDRRPQNDQSFVDVHSSHR